MAEQDDDVLLLYQELPELIAKMIDQEPACAADGRRRVQLSKILQDDDDDGDDHLLGHTDDASQDSLDQLQLTKIIEDFSLPASPLLADPLFCASRLQLDERPDTTHQGYDNLMSTTPLTSGRNSANSSATSVESQQNFAASIGYHDQHLHQQRPFHDLQHQQHQDTQQQYAGGYLAADKCHPAAAYQLEQSLAFQQQQHLSHDTTSENEYFRGGAHHQPVSSTILLSPTNSSSFCASPAAMLSARPAEAPGGLASRHESDGDDEACAASRTSPAKSKTTKLTKTRAKRKRAESQDKLERDGERANCNSGDAKKRRRRAGACDADAAIIVNSNAPKSATTDQTNNEYLSSQHISSSAANDTSEEEDDDDDDDGRHSTMRTDATRGRNQFQSSPASSLATDSRYRRCTANERERIRMREINQAFEKLKRVVPVEMIQQVVSGDESDQTNLSGSRRGSGNKSSNGQSQDGQPVKLTKIITLKLAVSYIAKLRDLLIQSSGGDCDASRVLIRADDSAAGANSRTTDGRSRDGPAKRARRRKCRPPREDPTKNDASTCVSQPKLSGELAAAERVQGAPAQQLGGGQLSRIVLHNSQPLEQQQQQQQQQQVILTNGVINRSLSHANGATTTLIPIQQPQIGGLQQKYTIASINHHPPQLQQVAIAQTGAADRAFVTPVAVAILGIPSGGYAGSSGDAQPIQILGLHNSGQMQRAHHQPHSAANFGLLNQQPQQVTLTLNDINGLSVIRLNKQADGRPFAPAHQLVAPTGGYGYAANLQPVQLQQQPIGGQFRRPANVVPSESAQENPQTPGVSGDDAGFMAIQNSIGASGDDHQQRFALAQHQQQQPPNQICFSAAMKTPTTITGIQSDCTNDLGDGQLQLNQQFAAAQPTGGNLIYINEPMTSSGRHQSSSAINQQVGGDGASSNRAQFQLTQQVAAPTTPHTMAEAQANNRIRCEQLKFVAQFSAQADGSNRSGCPTPSEDNIRQLVASIATSIPQRESAQIGSIGDNQAAQAAAACNQDKQSAGSQQQQQQQQSAPQQQLGQQAKRTYRFHNYDGNMITNHLYSNHQHDKSSTKGAGQHQRQPEQQAQPKASTGSSSGGAAGASSKPSQRSRQNSLSSTCSTTSSSSASLSPSNVTSPGAGGATLQSIMIASPSSEHHNRKHNRDSSSLAAGETADAKATASAMGEAAIN